MSKIILGEGEFVTKERYGVKSLGGVKTKFVTYRDGLYLPIALNDEEESELRKQLAQKYGEKVSFSYPFKDNITIRLKQKRMIGSTLIIIERRRDSTLLYLAAVTFPIGLRWSKVEMGLRCIDEILRGTVIGKKLKEYWVERDSISIEEAETRLREITS
jgi:hypothetical protein